MVFLCHIKSDLLLLKLFLFSKIGFSYLRIEEYSSHLQMCRECSLDVRSWRATKTEAEIGARLKKWPNPNSFLQNWKSLPPLLPHSRPSSAAWMDAAQRRQHGTAQRVKDSTLVVTVSVLGIRPIGSAELKGALAASALTLAYWRLPLGCGRIWGYYLLEKAQTDVLFFFFPNKCLLPGVLN